MPGWERFPGRSGLVLGLQNRMAIGGSPMFAHTRGVLTAVLAALLILNPLSAWAAQPAKAAKQIGPKQDRAGWTQPTVKRNARTGKFVSLKTKRAATAR